MCDAACGFAGGSGGGATAAGADFGAGASAAGDTSFIDGLIPILCNNYLVSSLFLILFVIHHFLFKLMAQS